MLITSNNTKYSGADLEMLKGGVLIVCRAVGSNFVVALAVPMAVHRGV